MTLAKLLTLPVIFILLVCPCLLLVRSSSSEPELSEAYKIVYEANSTFSSHIMVMKADGSDPLNLVSFVGSSDPQWSPDGTRISYGYGADIYVMKPNGADRTNLTAHPALDGGEAWSPDSSQIAFLSSRDNDLYQLFIMNTDGSNVRQLTYGPNIHIGDPAWSPDGSQLAFSLDSGLMIIQSDGSNLRQLTNMQGNWPLNLAWSPDGSTISFVSQVRAADERLWEQIFVIKPDGSGLEQLTEGPANHRFPTWSPDSSQILFRAGENGTNVFVMNADGTNQLQLTDQPVYSNVFSTPDLTWSPDGRQIAYIGKNGFVKDIYVMNADGSGKTRLTTGSDVYSLRWRR